MVIARGGLIQLVFTVRLGDSAGAGEVSMPDIIARGTIHGMARIGVGADIGARDIGVVATGGIITITRHPIVIMRTGDLLIGIIGGIPLDVVQDIVADGTHLAVRAEEPLR